MVLSQNCGCEGGARSPASVLAYIKSHCAWVELLSDWIVEGEVGYIMFKS